MRKEQWKKQTGKLTADEVYEQNKHLSTQQEQQELKKLEIELAEVLDKINKIRPVQFHDIDCDDQLFNFIGLEVDDIENKVFVQIAMWNDNLPSHKENPLVDGRNNVILPL